MAKRDFPNDNFVWYNDDRRLAILSQDTESTSNEKTTEKYDTWQGSGNLSGTITATSTSAGSSVAITSASHGLAVGDRVTVSGTTSYNSTYTITAVTTNTFTVGATNSESSETGSWVSLFIDNGLRITYKSKYETVDAITDDLDADIGLDTSLHPALVAYVKARLHEDAGDVQKSQYYLAMYQKLMMRQRSRKSGVRVLSIPGL
tara:strand:- start:3108 stop:3719 length:612 start_codon:yes stop_codon:yes gene_type:complete